MSLHQKKKLYKILLSRLDYNNFVKSLFELNIEFKIFEKLEAKFHGNFYFQDIYHRCLPSSHAPGESGQSQCLHFPATVSVMDGQLNQLLSFILLLEFPL